MRKLILSLLIAAGWVTACGTKGHHATGTTTAAPPAPVAPVIEPIDGAYPITPMIPAQVAQLRARLDKLTVGMNRDQVLAILDLDSFHIHPFATANSSGIMYHIADGHTLAIGMKQGDAEPLLRWATFDGELWPKNNSHHLKPMTNSPGDTPQFKAPRWDTQ